MKRRSILLTASLCFFLFACTEQQKAPPPPPPPEVSVIETKAEDVPLYLEFVGQTHGLKDITIRARVEGFLEGIHFKEGSWVKPGDLLYTLESQPFEEKVATRMSGVAEVKTLLANAKGDLDRIKPLAEINAVSQSDLDAAQATYDAYLSSLEASKAQLRASKIELSYTKILSPINGIIGKTKAKTGDFVGKDPSPVILNTVSQVDTILVTFFITETQYLQFQRHKTATESTEATGNEEDAGSNFELFLIDGTRYDHLGKLDFVDREVDTTTGAMLVQASFPNPEKLLRPGQFTTVKIKFQVVKDAILIPQRSVVEIQGLYSVFVVGTDNKVATREITVGSRVGSSWMITEGLEPGEKVVYEGLQKVKDGGDANPTLVEVKTISQDKN
jgi:membrane fusion protein (multidrug efflux system)